MSHSIYFDDLFGKPRVCPRCRSGFTHMVDTLNEEAVYEECECGYFTTLLSPKGQRHKREYEKSDKFKAKMDRVMRVNEQAREKMFRAGRAKKRMPVAVDGNVCKVDFKRG